MDVEKVNYSIDHILNDFLFEVHYINYDKLSASHI